MKKIRIICIVLIATVVCLTGCSKEKGFWENNELRLIINANSYSVEDNDECKNSKFEIPKDLRREFNNLKPEIADFFSKEYNIDVSKKLEKMKIKVFSEGNNDSLDSFTGGRTKKGDDCIQINECIFTDYPEYVISTFLHETMHYIGFISEKPSRIDDGMAEHMANKCAQFIGIPYAQSEIYSYYTLIADQMCIANEFNIVKSYLTVKNFDICTHVAETLKNVSQPLISVKDLGSYFNSMVETLGIDYGDYSFGLAFEAQEITACYCRQFNLSTEQINAIRELYFVEDFEELKIQELDNGYAFA